MQRVCHALCPGSLDFHFLLLLLSVNWFYFSLSHTSHDFLTHNMGISGLLPLLKDIQVTRPLSEFAGQTIAVDAYVWLHRGTYGCAAELATGRKTHK